MDTLSSEFLIGVFVGLSIAGLTAIIWRYYQGWVKRAQSLDKPQMIPQFTKLTPNDVYQDAMRAKITIFLFWVIVVFIAVLIVAWIEPSIWNFIVNQIAMLF